MSISFEHIISCCHIQFLLNRLKHTQQCICGLDHCLQYKGKRKPTPALQFRNSTFCLQTVDYLCLSDNSHTNSDSFPLKCANSVFSLTMSVVMVEHKLQNIKLDYTHTDKLQNVRSQLKDPEVTSAVTCRRYCWTFYSAVGMVTVGKKTGSFGQRQGKRFFFSPKRPDIFWSQTSLLFNECRGGFFSGVKQAGALTSLLTFPYFWG